jgi:hypothetical protein
MRLRLCLSVTMSEGCNPSSLLSLTLHIARVLPSRLPPQSLLPHALSSCEVACGAISLTLVSHDGSMDRRFTSPSLIKPSTYQPASDLIQGQRATFGSPGQWSPNTVLILGGS